MSGSLASFPTCSYFEVSSRLSSQNSCQGHLLQASCPPHHQHLPRERRGAPALLETRTARKKKSVGTEEGKNLSVFFVLFFWKPEQAQEQRKESKKMNSFSSQSFLPSTCTLHRASHSSKHTSGSHSTLCVWEALSLVPHPFIPGEPNLVNTGQILSAGKDSCEQWNINAETLLNTSSAVLQSSLLPRMSLQQRVSVLCRVLGHGRALSSGL